MPTLFTRIINGEIPAEIVYKDDHVVAIKDINPQAPVHVLVIPRQEIPGVAHAEPGDATIHLIPAARHVAELLGLENGYRLVINQGIDAGQTVDHIHVHLLGGRKLEWPPG